MGINNYYTNKEQNVDTTARAQVADKNVQPLFTSCTPLWRYILQSLSLPLSTNSCTPQQQHASASGGNRGLCLPSLWLLWYFKVYQYKLAVLIVWSCDDFWYWAARIPNSELDPHLPTVHGIKRALVLHKLRHMYFVNVAQLSQAL
jgi:hypothetical protein